MMLTCIVFQRFDRDGHPDAVQFRIQPHHQRPPYGPFSSFPSVTTLRDSANISSSADDVGNIILWTVVECDLGIIAGSMPMLRKLVKSLARDGSSHPSGSTDLNLVTIGQIKGRHHPIHDGAVRVTIAAGDDRDSGRDDESTRQMIKVTKTVERISMEGVCKTV